MKNGRHRPDGRRLVHQEPPQRPIVLRISGEGLRTSCRGEPASGSASGGLQHNEDLRRVLSDGEDARAGKADRKTRTWDTLLLTSLSPNRNRPTPGTLIPKHLVGLTLRSTSRPGERSADPMRPPACVVARPTTALRRGAPSDASVPPPRGSRWHARDTCDDHRLVTESAQAAYVFPEEHYSHLPIPISFGLRVRS